MTSGDLPFPTMVVGSLPRPRWVMDLIEDRKFGRIGVEEADALLDDAVPLAIRMQERAGLDFVSDGEWRRESYVKVFSEAVGGFENDLIGSSTPIASAMYPAVVSELRPMRPIATGEAAFLMEHTDARTVVAVPSPYTLARRMWSPDHSTQAYETREEFMEACVPIVRDEVRALLGMGVDAVQIDDPWLGLLVDADYRERDGITDVDHEIEQSIRGVNATMEAIDPGPVSVHLCHAHFNREHATTGSYDLVMEALGEMNVRRFALELATPDAGGLDCLRRFPSDKVLGLGVIDHTDVHVETPQEVAARTQRAMEYVPAERISLNPDCGFAPSSVNPMDLDEAYLKLSAMCGGASLLREQYG